ncbi:CNNM domain-containing protein [Halorussus halophilus]|uniref:CNNM domain-containing protein n=1 Tax=Halorussus halophilus TaxID=2650975 RepID=UPI00130100FE|nr:hemolysin family protein [Halorussus halophilus]
MVDIATAGRLVAGMVLLLGNGYFVTIEFAMTRVRQFAEEEFQGSRGLERAWEMTERLEIYLSGCQLGITVCSVGLGVVAEPALAAVLDPAISALGLDGLLGGGSEGGHTALATVSALGIINLLHLTVGEQAPTYLGIERTKFVTKYGAPILYWWTRILSPIIRLADWVAKRLLSLFGVTITRSWAEEELEDETPEADTRGELLSQMGDVLGNMDLPAERRREVINALAIDRIEAADIMVQRDEVVPVSTRATTEENFETIRETPHTRFPLVGAGLDDPIGTIYVPALVRDEEKLDSGEYDFEDVASPLLTVAPDIPVSDLIDTYQDEQQELALVVEDGETLGLVTATDAFEAIAGEIEDPLDEEVEA